MVPRTSGLSPRLSNVSFSNKQKYLWQSLTLFSCQEAKESIYILDWWLSPELYLRRPPAKNEQYRLDRMLKAAAERGVKVYCIVYKEVAAALSLDSSHTRTALEALHENIRVFRHPDHYPTGYDFQRELGKSVKALTSFDLFKASGDALKAVYGTAGDVVLYWAHHEKLLVIDNGKIGFMGGLDMCFGRWDTSSHPIADAHPGNLDEIIFPGQDYNNARVYDFANVKDWDQNQLDRTKSSRMGWSDVTLSMNGPITRDMVDHFVDRW
jgi:phospholipase D1/2